MAFLTINGTAYLVRVGEARGRVLLVEQRRRAIDASLLVDRVAEKFEGQVELTGTEASGRFFTPSEADSVIATLVAGNVTVGGDFGSFTARAKDVGYIDAQSYQTNPPTLFRWITCTLEEV